MASLRRDPHLIAAAIRAALHQRGTPYVWGGSAPGGFDCSGLVYWAYRRAGYSGIGRTTYTQITQGVPVSARNLQPGDIVFPSAHHEGLYVGNGMVLEAPHTGDHVKLIPLSSFGFMTARRLIGGGGGVVPPRKIAGQGAAGLPVASGNPADRVPRPHSNLAAAFAALGMIKPVTINAPHLALQSPADALQRVLDPSAQPLGSPSLGPVAPAQLAPTLGPSGRTAAQGQLDLDTARRRLLTSFA